MIVRIDAEVKDRSNKLAGGEGKTENQMVRELIGNYTKGRNIRSRVIGRAWENSQMKYKVFVDTNILLSGIFFEGNESSILDLRMLRGVKVFSILLDIGESTR